MDLHIFKESLVGTSSNYEELWNRATSVYEGHGSPHVLTRLQEIESRVRYL